MAPDGHPKMIQSASSCVSDDAASHLRAKIGFVRTAVASLGPITLAAQRSLVRHSKKKLPPNLVGVEASGLTLAGGLVCRWPSAHGSALN